MLVDGLFLLVYRVEFVRDAHKNSRLVLWTTGNALHLSGSIRIDLVFTYRWLIEFYYAY